MFFFFYIAQTRLSISHIYRELCFYLMKFNTKVLGNDQIRYMSYSSYTNSFLFHNIKRVLSVPQQPTDSSLWGDTKWGHLKNKNSFAISWLHMYTHPLIVKQKNPKWCMNCMQNCSCRFPKTCSTRICFPTCTSGTWLSQARRHSQLQCFSLCPITLIVQIITVFLTYIHKSMYKMLIGN